MHKLILSAAVLLCLPLVVFSQKPKEPVNSGQLLAKGINLHDQQDYEGALEFYEKIPRNDTNYVVALYERSMTLLALKRYDDAIAIAKEGMAYKSEYDSQFYITLGSALDDSGKPEAAIEAYTNGIKRFPNNNMLYFNRAVTYRKMEKTQESVNDLKESVRLNPLHASSHLLLGTTALLENKIVEGMLAVNAFLLIEPFTQRAQETVGMMDQLNKEKLEVEPKGVVFTKQGDDFSEIDVLLRNRVFANKGFKVPLKLDYYFVKQNYLLFQQLSDNESKYQEGFFTELYVPFFISVYRSGMFDEFTLYQLMTVQAPTVQKMIKKKESSIKKFISWAIDEFKQKTSNHRIVWQGKEQKIRHWYFKASHLESIGNADPSGTKAVGYWENYNSFGSVAEQVTYDDQGRRQGLAKGYYSTGELEREITYTDGKGAGFYKMYHKNGKLKMHNDLKDDQLTGLSREYYLDGTIESETEFLNGMRNGKSKVYYPTNSIRYEVDYKNDVFTGKIKEFDVNGKLKYEGEFVDGKKAGNVIYYFPNGSIEAKYMYAADEPNGEFETYHKNGKLYKKGTYKNGIRISKYTSWYDNGKLYEEQEYDEDGKGNGIQKEYAEEGNLIYEAEIRKDALLWYKFYDKSGKVISEGKEDKGKLMYNGHYSTGEKYTSGEFQKGKRNGLWKYYTRVGVLFKEEIYKEGELQEERSIFTNGKIKEITRYKGGLADGPYELYYYNGKVAGTGWYQNGEQNGYWNYYYADGTPKSTSYYVAGVRYGPQTNYSVNGRITSEIISDLQGRDTRCVYYDTSGKILDDIDFGTTTGEILAHHENGQPKFRANYKNDWGHGTFTWYFSTGKVDTEGQYLNNQKTGKWISYSLEGKLDYEGFYKEDEQDSTWKYYYNSGKIRHVQYYDEGEKTGEWVEYYENGQIASKKNYKDGYRHGPSYYFNEDGQLRLVKNFTFSNVVSYSYMLPDGKMSPEKKVGSEKTTITAYYKNGSKSEEYSMENNELEGSYVIYYPNGSVMEKSEYHGGIQEGQQENFYSNGKLKGSENYLNDELHGLCVYYDALGNIERELNYMHGDLHGICKYYEKGKLVKTRIYYDDVFISEEIVK